LLERHAHFHGRSRHFRYEADGDVLTVQGTVPRFYLKQLLQAALKVLGVQIDNQVMVACYINPRPIDLEPTEALQPRHIHLSGLDAGARRFAHLRSTRKRRVAHRH
jgi:hypothetical protein